MIKLVKVNKYFNKNKSNEIHVLNDINVEFPECGLVAIMGQSGSGKTTLLNVLCGLDKIQSGTIEVGGTSVSSYSNKTWDRLRILEFGYIFQNYNLFLDKTVFENVSFSLELLGINDKDQIEQKTLEALSLVGMNKFRNRLCSNLSGGQMQRVAIARAIVKDPHIVIADEPTGNLDEKNTLQIMNILKKISKKTLVILVTHEKEIGEFYADEIINIVDGKLDNRVSGNCDAKELVLKQDENIYLKDLNCDETKAKSVTLKTYYSDTINANINVNLVVVDNEIYISATADDKTIKYETNTNIKLVDEHKPVYDSKHVDNKIEDFVLPNIDKSKCSTKYKVGFWTSLKNGFKQLSNVKKFKKICILGFFLSALMLVLSASAYFKTKDVGDEYLDYDRNLTTVLVNRDYDSNEVISKLDEIGFKYLPQTESGYVKSTEFQTLEMSYRDQYLNASYLIADINNLGYTLNAGEIVIDELIANRIYSTSLYNGNTIHTDSQLFNSKFYMNNEEFTIKEISHLNNAVIFMNKDDYFRTAVHHCSIDNTLLDNEIILPLGYGSYTTYEYCGKTYDVKGYTTEMTGPVILNEDNALRSLLYNELEYSHQANGYLDKTPEEIADIVKGSTMFDRIFNRYDDYLKYNGSNEFQTSKVLLILSSVILAATLIFLYFLMKSNMIARIKEVGIYRALGLTKNNIKKMYMFEGIAITIMGSLTGWLFGLFIIFRTRSLMPGFNIFAINPLVLFGCIGIDFCINMLVSILPVSMLLRNTPYEILSKYDI